MMFRPLLITTEQHVRLPTRGFLLVFFHHRSSCGVEQTDGRTDERTSA